MFRNARAWNTHVEENLNHPFPAQVVNAAAYAARFGLAFHLWVGELPAALAASAGPICLRSRWREGAGFGGPNSNHYNKVLAAAALLDRPGVPGVLFRDVDMFAPAGGGGARDPRDLHEHGRVDAAFPCTSKIDRDAPRRKRGGPPRGFRLKSTKFYLRRGGAARARARAGHRRAKRPRPATPLDLGRCSDGSSSLGECFSDGDRRMSKPNTCLLNSNDLRFPRRRSSTVGSTRAAAPRTRSRLGRIQIFNSTSM